MSSFTLTTHQAGCWKLLFRFPEGGTAAHDCGFSLAHRAWSVFLRALPLPELTLTAALGSSLRELAESGWRCGFSTRSIAGAHGLSEGSSGEVLP